MFVGGVCWALLRIPAKPIRYGCLTLFLGFVAVSQGFAVIQGALSWYGIDEEQAFKIALSYVLVASLSVAWFTWNRRERKPPISQNLGLD